MTQKLSTIEVKGKSVKSTLDTGTKLPKCTPATAAGLRTVEKKGFNIEVGGVYIDSKGTIMLVTGIKDKHYMYRDFDYEDLDMNDYEHNTEWQWWAYNGVPHFLFSSKGMSFEEVSDKLIEIEQKSAKMSLAIIDQTKDDDKISESTAITTGASKELLVSMRGTVEKKKMEVKMYHAFLERMASRMGNVVSKYRDQIEKLSEVIDIIELYLGIHEEVYRLKTGNPADPSVPISFRQQVLYIDEEVGDARDGGWDFKKLEDFDRWLLKDDKYKTLIPEEKGIVVMKPRRSDKDYSSDRVTNFFMNLNNKKTFFLIRNGENLYQIWTSISVYHRMFPTRDEFDPKKDEFLGITRGASDDDKKQYTKQALMFQGIMDRSDILKPIPPGVNIMKPATYQGMVNFIRDDELCLPTGRKPWKEWKKEINSKIVRGSRILFVNPGWRDKKYWQGRLPFYHSEWKELPVGGIYKVVSEGAEDKFAGKSFKIMFNPGDEVWDGYSYAPRKRGYSMKLYQKDEIVFNYDLLNLDDVEFYINCRSERHQYLEMMPVLRRIRKERIEEIKWEQEFVRLVMERTGKTKKIVIEALRWWKYKNIWNRPVKEDDAKALRMIEQRVRKEH